MGLEKYALASNALAREFAASLTSEDVIALATELSADGRQAWLRWQGQHETVIDDYVAATPVQRQKRKEWSAPDLRRRLVLAAILHCEAAHALLGFLAAHEGALSPGGSYRDTTAIAGTLYWKLCCIDIPEWPEEFEDICPSPFPQGD